MITSDSRASSIDACSLLEQVSDAVIVLDQGWRFVYVNSGAELLCGRKRACLVGRGCWEIFGQGQGSFEVRWRQAMAEQKPAEFQDFLPLAKRWLEVRALPGGGTLTVFLRDITARVVAEENLRTSEQKYQSLIERNPDGIFTLGADGRITFANAACAMVTGYSQEELLSKTFQDLCAPDQLDKSLRKVQRTLAGEPPQNLETALIAKDGRRIDILITGGPIVQDGKVVAIHCAFKDLTVAKCLADALQQREEQYQTLVENVPDIIERFDRELRFVYANPALERYTGLPVSHFIGKTKAEAGVPEELCARWTEALSRVFAEGQEDSFEFDYDSPRGLVHMFARLVPEFGADCNVEYVLNIIRDMTGKRQAELALEQARDEARAAQQAAQRQAEELAALMEIVPAGIWIAHDPTCQRITGNHAAHELFGVAEAENLSQTPAPGESTPRLRFFCGGKELEPLELPMQQAARQGREIRDVEMEVQRPDGQRKTIYGHAFPLRHPDGTIRGVLATYMDITLIKAAKMELLKAKEAAEHASKTKDHFLAMLSHELRNPLTPVLTTAEMMQQDPYLSAEQRAGIELIHRNIALETRLIDDLLDLNRLAHGKISLQRRAVDMHDILHQAVRTCRTDICAKDLRLSIDTGAEQSHVDGDPTRLQQILWNLLRNAIKFTPAGGTITLTTDNTPQGAIAIHVQDTGVGIAPEMLPRIFNAFEQGGADVNRQYGGLGLGLAISRTLAELHGGSLAVSSAGRGQGAMFTVQLPVLTAPHVLASDQGTEGNGQRAAPRGRLGTILLVEDHLDTAQVMTHLLESFGYQVRTATTVAAAVRAAAEKPFDILISDIGLPDGSGLDLMAQLAQTRPIPAIALSGYGMEEDIQRSVEAGFRAHLIKPVDLQALDRALQALRT